MDKNNVETLELKNRKQKNISDAKNGLKIDGSKNKSRKDKGVYKTRDMRVRKGCDFERN